MNYLKTIARELRLIRRLLEAHTGYGPADDEADEHTEPEAAERPQRLPVTKRKKEITMKPQDLRNELRQDPEYVVAERELKPLLNLADEILELRLEREWSQAELARRVGTKQANISRIENGLGNPTYRFLQKLAETFGTELSIHANIIWAAEQMDILEHALERSTLEEGDGT